MGIRTRACRRNDLATLRISQRSLKVCRTEVSTLELPYSDGDHMRRRALRGRADVQADERRPCRRCMAAASLSVDATMYIMHRSQVIRCLCIGSSPDVHAHGYTHGSTALLRSPSDLPELPVQWLSRLYPDSSDSMQAEAILSCNRDRIA
jgi:hypothetical protein